MGDLNNKTILFSGTFPGHERTDLEKQAEAAGAKLLSGVSKNLNYLVAGEKMGPQKRDKAEELGVPIITLDDFFAMLPEGGTAAPKAGVKYKNKEIDAAKSNFPEGIIPDKVLLFYEFAVRNGECDLFDYESISEGKHFLSNLLTDKVMDHFVPFYVDKAHAIFAFWILDKQKPLESMPVVYVDTEGSYRVCAADFDEFVYLFSRVIVIRLSRLMVKYIESQKTGNYCKNPYKAFDAESLKEMDKENKKDYSCYTRFKKYIIEKIGITLDSDPVSLVENAIKNNPNLLDYLRENGGLKYPS